MKVIDRAARLHIDYLLLYYYFFVCFKNVYVVFFLIVPICSVLFVCAGTYMVMSERFECDLRRGQLRHKWRCERLGLLRAPRVLLSTARYLERFDIIFCFEPMPPSHWSTKQRVVERILAFLQQARLDFFDFSFVEFLLMCGIVFVL